MTNEEFIHVNREADIRSLALKKVPEGVDFLWCMRQIEGYQLAKKKLPRWAETEGIWYPPRISMEQCSSEATAQYKTGIVDRLRKTLNNPDTAVFADLTGGFGVDFSYMAREFNKAYYVEQQEVLCQAAEHNMPLLGLSHAYIINKVTTQEADLPVADIFFLDPARRDIAGKKTVAIEDCTPDLTTLQDTLLSHSTYVMVKLSPMLDITQALRSLHNVVEIHVVSVKGECKELLFVLSGQQKGSAITTYCVNLNSDDEDLIVKGRKQTEPTIAIPQPGCLLFEPNASIMKAGLENSFGFHYGFGKLHPMSNLFVSTGDAEGKDSIKGIPARTFSIVDIYDFSKTETKRLRQNLTQANITVRNFPATVAELRKRMKIKEGGNDYLFVTTLKEGNRHVIIHCQKR